ncbi:MAG: MFS transporter [Clostridiales Family XIII bacterium]|jgi:fucose permease|nr:MFS transporter [Clostridiales Family XIII bacterium]
MKKDKLFLLVMLYLIFVGTGICNSLLGSAWPAISADLDVAISLQTPIILLFYAGAVLGATSAKSWMERFREHRTCWLAMLFMAAAVWSYSATRSYAALVVLGLLLGFGMGLLQSAVNGTTAKNYSTSAMNWLHCCFALGCTLAPALLSWFILRGGWQSGYRASGVIVAAIFVAVVLSRPLWKALDTGVPDGNAAEGESDAQAPRKSIGELLRVPGGTLIPLNMFLYAFFEVSFFFWFTSYLTTEREFGEAAAAGMMTFFYGAQMAGRMLSGFMTLKVRGRHYKRAMSILIVACAVWLLFVPDGLLPAFLIVFGMATGPIYPLIIHEVPAITGRENAQGVIGLQMAASNLGSAISAVAVGALASRFSFGFFPWLLLGTVVVSLAFQLIQDRKYQ